MFQDLRTGWRSLARNPLFTLAAAGSLALGIRACTVIFSVVYALLLHSLPYPKLAELVHIGMDNLMFPGRAFEFLSFGTFKTLRCVKNSGLSASGGFRYDSANLTGVPEPIQLTAGLSIADYSRVHDRRRVGCGRIIRQLLTECAVLRALGGVLGLLVMMWAMDAITLLSPQGIPRFHEVHLNWAVLVFAAAVAVGTGVLVGLWPAWRVSGVATMGTQPGNVPGLVLREGCNLLAIVLLIGLAAAWGLGRLLSTMLYRVRGSDPLILGSVSAVLAGAALLACWLPARRATRVDPLVAIQKE